MSKKYRTNVLSAQPDSCTSEAGTTNVAIHLVAELR
jgi:hypothetical protein